MVTPDPISEWSQDEISSWINGLDNGLDRYKEALKFLTGDQLLMAKYSDLYQYGIAKLGHQEAILDAVNLLDDTVREIRYGSLKTTAKRLVEKCLKLQNLRNPIQSDRPIGGHGFGIDSVNSSQLSNKHFELALEVLSGVRQLINHLQSYSSNGYSGQILQGHANDHAKLAKLALELSRTALQPLPAWASLEPITNCCFELFQLASRIQSSQFADERPQLESVNIRRNTEFSLGLYLRMRQDDGRLEITGTKDGADAKDKIFAGDELIAINDQIVVGWSLNNVVAMLKSCRMCRNQCDGSCNDFDAKLTIKRSYINSEVCYSSNVGDNFNLYDARSRSTPDVNFGTTGSVISSAASRRRSGPSHIERRDKPRLSLPPPPSEPYRPKRPQSMDIAAQRAHSLGNLTGSESPNSLMDAATFAAAQHNGSLQNFNAPEMHLYPQPVYEEKPRDLHNDHNRHLPSNDRLSQSARSSTRNTFESRDGSTDDAESFDTEQSLIEKLKSSSITPNSSLPRRQFNSTYSDFHSRQNSATSAGRDSRISQTGTNHSIHSNHSEQSSLSQDTKEPPEEVTKVPLNDICHGKQSSWNNFNQHNNKSRNDIMSRCRSEPRLTEKQNSFDSLSDGLDASKPLKSIIEVKQLGKNILNTKWKKYWAVLQNNSLYIYYDKTETAMIQEPLILYGQKVTPPENKCNKKYSFQLTGSRCDILLAAETAEWRTKWMNALGLAAIGYKNISSDSQRRSGPDLSKITTGPVMRRDQAPKPVSDLSRKAMSVENINKLKPVLMKNINLNQKSRADRSKSDILDIVLDEKRLKEEADKEENVTSRAPRPKSFFLESDF